MFNEHGTARLIRILKRLKSSGVVLLLLSSVAMARPVQTIDSETQLASILCTNPTDETTNEVLLNNHPNLVNVALWNALVNCASATQQEGPRGKSIEIYKLILRVADRLKKPELVAATWYYLGQTYSRINDVENSIRAYETSRKLFAQVGIENNLIYVLADLGALYLTVEDYEQAQSFSEQSLVIIQRLESSPPANSLMPIEYGQARALQTLGEIDLHEGKHGEALKKLGEARTSYERLNSASSSYNLQIARVLIALAQTYGELGEYGRAFSYLSKAHQISSSSGDLNIRANIMSNQAALFLAQDDYAAAQKYCNASLAIYRSLGDTREEARVLLYLAVVEQRQGHHANALELFQRSMERGQTAKLPDIRIAAGEGLSVLLTAKGDFPNALHVLAQSLELARRVNAKSREVELLWRSAQTHYAMGNYRESARLAEQALSRARSLHLRRLTYLASVALGEAYLADDKVELASTVLKDAVDQLEALRDEVAGRTEGRYLFFENKVEAYQALVKLLTKSGRNFEALIYADRAKGRVLLEAVRNNRYDLKDTFSETEKAEADSLINKLHAINERIRSQGDGGESKAKLENELNVARSELALFNERLAHAHPELLLRSGPARPLTQARLNNLLGADDRAYVEYVVTGDNVGAFILKRNGLTAAARVSYISLPLNTNELRLKVDEFHAALAERDPAYNQLGHELYRLLIAPLAKELQNVKTICIIPDEFLWTLPFQALTTTRGNFLIQEYSVYYAPSLSVLDEMSLRKPQKTSNDSLLAFGNPVIEKDDKLKQDLHPIPEAEAEVGGVTRSVGTGLKKVFVGPQADEKTFKALAPEYATIHIATHGVLDNQEPLNSYLMLTRTDGDPENDGFLQAREIIEMHLDADLAVLSACETGNGRVSPGEGVVGMSWAFLVAGARSVVVSQWRVNSASTSQLMKNFYEALSRQNDLNSRNKAQALREASLRLLKSRRYSHPFYWAGFVLVSSN